MNNQDSLKQLINIQKQLNQICTPAHIQALEVAQKQNMLIESIFGSYQQYEIIAHQFQNAYKSYKHFDTPALQSAIKISNIAQAWACWNKAVKHIDWESASKENLKKDDIEEAFKKLTVNVTAESSSKELSKINLSNISSCCNIATFISKLLQYASSPDSKEDLKNIFNFLKNLIEKANDFFNN